MGLRRLLEEGRLARQRTSPGEIARLLDSADHFLRNARVPDLEPTARYLLLYGAALDLTMVILRAASFRPRGPGHHEAAFECLEDLLRPGGGGWATYLQACRERRNLISYVNWIDVPESETNMLLAKIQSFRELAISHVARSKPWLASGLRRKRR